MDINTKCCACSEGDSVVTVRVGDMLKHNADHHPNHSFKCELCLSAFTSKAAKEKHERTEHVKIQCIQCHRRGYNLFLARDEFSAHYRAEHKFFTVDCEKCPNRFQSQRTCNEHMRMAHDHPPLDPVIRCLNCKNYSNVKNGLRSHNAKVHGRNYPFECSYCANCFKSQKLRNEHAETCPYRG